MNGFRILALAAAVSMVASTGWAMDWDQQTVSRSWKDQSTYLSTTLRVDLPSSGTGYQAPTTINVNLRIPSDAKLRLGEIERFKVEARVRSGKAGYQRIEVTFTPETYYYRYWRDTQWVNVYGKDGTDGKGYEWCNFYVNHSGRVKTGAPATVEKVKVDFTTPAEPFTMQWQDFGFAENGSAPTSYKVVIFRSSLFSTKLVAKGVVERVDGDVQSIVIEKNGPFTQGADEWFQTGQKYWVFILVKRTGTEFYSDEFGAAFEGAFTYKAQDKTVVEGPSGAAQRMHRQNRFDDLYRD